MKVKELKETLDEYDGEMEVIIVDAERDVYEVLGVTINRKGTQARLALILE